MATSEAKTKIYPPVIPFSTLSYFIESLKSIAVPPVIDTSLLGKMSGSTRSSLMSAMRFLGLINAESSTSDRLKKLVGAFGTEDWRTALADELTPAYSDIVTGIDLSSGTAAQLYDAFRKNGNIDGQMLEKAVRFYLSLLTEAGQTYSPHFKSRTIRTPSKKIGGKKASAKSKVQEPANNDAEEEMEEMFQARFQIPIPDKGNAVITLPRSIDEADWQMVKAMLDAYVNRLTSGK